MLIQRLGTEEVWCNDFTRVSPCSECVKSVDSAQFNGFGCPVLKYSLVCALLCGGPLSCLMCVQESGRAASE